MVRGEGKGIHSPSFLLILFLILGQSPTTILSHLIYTLPLPPPFKNTLLPLLYFPLHSKKKQKKKSPPFPPIFAKVSRVRSPFESCKSRFMENFIYIYR